MMLRDSLRALGISTVLAFGAPVFANTAPVLDAIADQTVPAGKSLIIPLTASDADGDPVSFTVTSSSGSVLARVKSGQPILEMDVTHTGDSGDSNDPDYAGSMFFTMFKEWTPETVSTYSGLTQGGYYNGLTFHAVYAIVNIQGGDPLANSKGGPGFTFHDEYLPQLIFSGDAQLAMANGGPDSNGSQFFITYGAQRGFDFNFTIFGQLTRGLAIRDSIRNTPVSSVPISATESILKPNENVTVTSQKVVTRSGPNNSDAILLLTAPGTNAVSTITVTVDDGKGGTNSKVFMATPVTDDTNDPPFQSKPFTDKQAAVHTVINMPFAFTDLEHDPVRLIQGPIYPVPNALRYLLKTKSLLLLPPNGYKEAMNWVIAAYQQGAIARGNRALVHSYFDITDYDINQISVGDVVYKASPVNVTASKGVALTNAVVAKLSASHLPKQYGASINWGDGTVSAGTVTKTSDGQFNITGTHTYAKGGAFPLAVSFYDSFAEFNSSNQAVTVNGARSVARSTVFVTDSLVLVTVKGSSLKAAKSGQFSGAVATFTDSSTTAAEAADYSALIDWGDGKIETGTVSGSSVKGFHVAGSHKYADADAYSVAIRVLRVSDSLSACGYSTMQVPGPLVTMPPFNTMDVQGKWLQLQLTTTNAGTGSVQNHLSGQYEITNTGKTASPAGTLTIYHSTDNQFTESPSDTTDTNLLQITVPALQPGKHTIYVISSKASADHPPLDLKAGTDYSKTFATNGGSIISVLDVPPAAPNLIEVKHVMVDFPTIK